MAVQAIRRFWAVFNLGANWHCDPCVALEPPEDDVHVFNVAGRTKREARIRAVRKARKARLHFEDSNPFSLITHLDPRPQKPEDYVMPEGWN